MGLGLQIPMPTASLAGYAATASAFLIVTRFLSIFPLQYLMKSGLRASLLPAINLSQVSEFSLAIATLGRNLGHIDAQTAGIITFVFAILSVASTYMIQYNHQLQQFATRVLKKAGLKNIPEFHLAEETKAPPQEIVFLGFFREASSIFHEI